ncbi:MAG: hypothetical protein RBS99_12035, partial [Rhodospirillales bacterium]|nr:hypothetical protein [Rhodospirillales bacterium]
MKIEITFPELEDLARRMGAKPSRRSPSVGPLDPLEELRKELEEGKEIDLADIETTTGGLLGIGGEQV